MGVSTFKWSMLIFVALGRARGGFEVMFEEQRWVRNEHREREGADVDQKEEGEVKEHVVIREIMMDTGRILKSLSTVDGLRDLTMAPMAMMVNLVKRKGK